MTTPKPSAFRPPLSSRAERQTFDVSSDVGRYSSVGADVLFLFCLFVCFVMFLWLYELTCLWLFYLLMFDGWGLVRKFYLVVCV